MVRGFHTSVTRMAVDESKLVRQWMSNKNTNISSQLFLSHFSGGDEGVLDGEDIFDEGGFDFDDDYGGSDGGDMW